MNQDLMKLAILVVVAVGVYYFYQGGAGVLSGLPLVGRLVKNEGNVNIDPDEMKQMLQQTAKKVVHGQIDNISEDDHVKQDELYKHNTNVLPAPQMSNNFSPQGNFMPATMHNFANLDCFPKDQLVAKDLLPREDAYNVWSQSNPPVQGHLSNKNFIESGHHFGLNTVGQSLKNPNLQLRSDPLIPMRTVGPW